ncbi:MAG: energy transducer TonB [Gemmatimonadaceae bacterium]|nr:energy transducer TonB [Gemmatimonadaceae bacterium]
MRLWIQSYTSTTAVAPSAVLSMAAHAVLIGAAVYGTGVQSRELVEEISQRIYYLPPPDRMPANDAVRERIQYVDVGSGARVHGEVKRDGTLPGQPKPEENGGGRGAQGADPVDQQAQLPMASDDSVYSILNVEEAAVRSEGSAAPIYPPELIANGIEGAVVTTFVIDTTGRADTTTIDIVQSSHPLFVASVRTAIPGMRFSPAMVQGRRVRQVVEQRFQFRITPPTPLVPAEHTRASPGP